MQMEVAAWLQASWGCHLQRSLLRINRFRGTGARPLLTSLPAPSSMMESKAYESEAFNRLPLLTDAVKSFDALDGDALVATDSRELFLRHGVDRMLGLTLLHRHSSSSPTGDSSTTAAHLFRAASARFAGTSGPATGPSTTMSSALMSSAIRAGRTLGPISQSLSCRPSPPSFAGSCTASGRRGSLDSAVDCPGDDFTGRVEITEGRANINLKPET